MLNYQRVITSTMFHFIHYVPLQTLFKLGLQYVTINELNPCTNWDEHDERPSQQNFGPLRFDIPMHHAMFVAVCQRRSDLPHHTSCRGLRQMAHVHHVLEKFAALEVFHHQIPGWWRWTYWDNMTTGMWTSQRSTLPVNKIHAAMS